MEALFGQGDTGLVASSPVPNCLRLGSQQEGSLRGTLLRWAVQGRGGHIFGYRSR